MKKKGFFAEQYSRCWKFFNETRWFVVFAIGVFALTFIIGFAYPNFFRTEILNFITELMLKFEGKGTFEMVGIIKKTRTGNLGVRTANNPPSAKIAPLAPTA